jgi:hypothetical protein
VGEDSRPLTGSKRKGTGPVMMPGPDSAGCKGTLLLILRYLAVIHTLQMKIKNFLIFISIEKSSSKVPDLLIHLIS